MMFSTVIEQACNACFERSNTAKNDSTDQFCGRKEYIRQKFKILVRLTGYTARLTVILVRTVSIIGYYFRTEV